MRDWFDAREAKEFGTSLAAFLLERLPASAGETAARPVSEKKRNEVVAKLLAQVDRYRATHQLNFYKKAKLGNAFKWELADKGYDPALIDALTKEVLLRL